MANLTNFGEQFSSKVLRKMYAGSVIDAVSNRDYEGEIKKPGDRVNILSFLNDVEYGDYVVGTDMTSSQIVDAEEQLLVEKRKFYNFALDRLEDVFTYAGDIPEALIENHAQKLASITDAYGLDKFGSGAKAGNWIGTNFLVTGAAATMASLTTTATGGTITVVFDSTNVDDQTASASVENPLDGVIYNGGFENTDLYKGIRMVSTRAIVSPWWRISGVTSSVAVTITEWDEATAGPDFAENYTLRGVFGGDGVTFPKYTDAAGNDVGAWVAQSGFGWEVQAAIATAVSAGSIYDQVTLLNQALDDNETPADNRKMTVAPWGMTQIRQAAELQPTGIADLYKEMVLNGKAGRLGSFDLYVAQGARLSTRYSRSTATGIGASTTKTTGTQGYIMPAHHTSALTFADKWSESRVVDAENQFAKKYQGLFLFGALIPRLRRKNVAVLLGSM
jgi:hypothetical protein